MRYAEPCAEGETGFLTDSRTSALQHWDTYQGCQFEDLAEGLAMGRSPGGVVSEGIA
jgi:hypothetical protein